MTAALLCVSPGGSFLDSDWLCTPIPPPPGCQAQEGPKMGEISLLEKQAGTGGTTPGIPTRLRACAVHLLPDAVLCSGPTGAKTDASLEGQML